MSDGSTLFCVGDGALRIGVSLADMGAGEDDVDDCAGSPNEGGDFFGGGDMRFIIGLSRRI